MKQVNLGNKRLYNFPKFMSPFFQAVTFIVFYFAISSHLESCICLPLFFNLLSFTYLPNSQLSSLANLTYGLRYLICALPNVRYVSSFVVQKSSMLPSHVHFC